jgi:hypothetical protein
MHGELCPIRLGQGIRRVGVTSRKGLLRTLRRQILHPKKRDVIAHPKVMRAEALECIRAARIIVETLYSEDH